MKQELSKHQVFSIKNCITRNNNMDSDGKKRSFLQLLFVVFGFITAGLVAPSTLIAQLNTPSYEKYTQAAAQRMIAAGERLLNPVYAPLAEQIVADYNLAEISSGIGIDLGSGPGHLIFELCKLTRLHWINADINPYFFAYFYAEAETKGFAHRVSAVFADARSLPFRDNYANIIVSRGSYHFWEDKELGFREIYRVLKPGGVAYIGRGFARDMPVDIARSIRDNQKNFPEYDPQAEAVQLKKIFEKLQIKSYRIERPVPPDSEGLNYGIWMEIRK